MLFQLEKPNLNNIDLKKILQALEYSIDKGALSHLVTWHINDFIKRVNDQEYLYWDQIKYKKLSSNTFDDKNVFSKEELWHLIKIIRWSLRTTSVIRDKNGKFFTWSKLNYFDEFLHKLDMDTGGEIIIESRDFNKINKQKLIAHGVMEEAIASSQLEGAATERRVAKKMLQEGRKPTNHSEQMILNNYLSMRAIEKTYKNEKMSLDLILELHRLITENTVDSENEAPRFREDGEPIYITNKINGDIYYQAPEVNFVKAEMIRLIDFANDGLEEQIFIHPVIKAIMLHFWIGYLHPFTDGNGRLARLLFYWYLIKKGYWAFAYLPISKAIKKSQQQYLMAYVYSEQDDNDLNYFLDYNLRKIKIAIADFKNYLNERASSNLKMRQKSEIKYSLNVRQIQLLQYLCSNTEERTTIKSHMNINQVGKITAIKDLKDLVNKGFLFANKKGRNVYYYGTEKIKGLFNEVTT